MFEYENFSGLGENNNDSLNSYGFVCKNEKSDQFYCIYKVKDFVYDEGFIHEYEIEDLLSEDKSYLSKEEINSFFNVSQINREEFFESNILKKIDKLVKFFGTDKIFGKSYQNLSFLEAKSIIDKE